MDKKTPEQLYVASKSRKKYKGIYQLWFKRFLDIIICLLALPIVFLVLIPVSIAIKIEDRGPIFYRSARLGVGFKEFEMLKFRSMKVNAPDLRNNDGSTFNSEKDSRVTKVGHFIRETSIDEIPQIFNILKGDMSIIGPRPGDVESKNTYAEDEKDKLLGLVLQDIHRLTIEIVLVCVINDYMMHGTLIMYLLFLMLKFSLRAFAPS